MEIERRERDPDTGDMLIGAGWSDMFGKLAAKLTGKTTSKIASKATEKLVEKGAEKVGEKTGQLIGEKIYDRFSKPKVEERKGKEIVEILRRESTPPSPVSSLNPDHQYIRDVYNDLL